MAKKAIYKSLYFQVILAIVIGVAAGPFLPGNGCRHEALW
jgi:Na+/H+-dicarboxylate symporter